MYMDAKLTDLIYNQPYFFIKMLKLCKLVVSDFG